MELTKEQLKQAREWIMECVWTDLEPEDVEELTDAQVIRGIKNHYAGGLLSFVQDVAN